MDRFEKLYQQRYRINLMFTLFVVFIMAFIMSSLMVPIFFPKISTPADCADPESNSCALGLGLADMVSNPAIVAYMMSVTILFMGMLRFWTTKNLSHRTFIHPAFPECTYPLKGFWDELPTKPFFFELI
jgi:hypothetical protein